MVKLAAFPKCYLDDIIMHKSMTVFDWIEKASQLGVDGLEMHDLFFPDARCSLPGCGKKEMRRIQTWPSR